LEKTKRKKGSSRSTRAAIERNITRRRNGDETRERIISAAERLFAENGVDAVSLRQIMMAARVNTALISYHFGTREGLLRAIFRRRVEPFNCTRLAMLEEAEVAHDPPRVEDLLRAFFLPPLEVSLSVGKAGRPKQRFGRIFSDSSRLTRRIIPEFMNEFQHRFMSSLKRALPSVCDKDLYWRLHVLLCILIQTSLTHERIRQLSGGLCSFRSPQELFQELLPILTAVVCAPSSPTPASGPNAVR
jgi:AcrR family transcriptional regulator